ncbi:helix-turn-helix domain-containing protein [Staphylococcus hyicus]|uniref:helix-turn-helix domain-containing protein n=1 Tax=Staphylococcus hyicus TaxID=1284 RepID=UPI00208E15A3|nr:helix-turn-helix transcriptional regulator [Staphylococcus hyicus]MCO4331985.1 helix-turn-helix domain-containing protein [Staphylococcus hyicus]MCO4334917.1 helix-turn-helix domain-containing protein [Staphylococcus hyicus]
MFSLDEKLSSKLREIRARKNITLQQASKEIGISSKTLSLIENEVLIKVKRTTYEKITKWLINEVK